jgi:hypothetical protein
MGAASLERCSFEEFPYLMEHVRPHLAERPQGQSDYEFGLDLILDGLERTA